MNNSFKLAMDRDLENVNEEFNNFLHRVTEVSTIVKNLASSDTNTQNIGLLEADRVLNTSKQEQMLENIDEKDIVLKIKSNRTVLNKKALHKKENQNGDTTDPEVFMEEVSKDAETRYKDKQIRTEKMQTFKTQATKAFRRGEYEKALCYYNKVRYTLFNFLYKNIFKKKLNF